MAGGKRTAADLGAWLVFEDESGQGLRPPKGRTWGRRGQTPVVTVTGGSNKRVSLAALIAVKPGCRPRLIYRVHARRRGDKRQGFTETGYARLLDAAHQQLDGPLVVVWDNLNTHVSGVMAGLIAARDWLTVFRLPGYASELNPVESVWSVLKRSLANLVKRDISELTALAKTRLRRMQYRPSLLQGFLARTRLDLTPFCNPTWLKLVRRSGCPLCSTGCRGLSLTGAPAWCFKTPPPAVAGTAPRRPSRALLRGGRSRGRARRGARQPAGRPLGRG